MRHRVTRLLALLLLLPGCTVPEAGPYHNNALGYTLELDDWTIAGGRLQAGSAKVLRLQKAFASADGTPPKVRAESADGGRSRWVVDSGSVAEIRIGLSDEVNASELVERAEEMAKRGYRVEKVALAGREAFRIAERELEDWWILMAEDERVFHISCVFSGDQEVSEAARQGALELVATFKPDPPKS